ncbi:hypothetical protein [Piscinibacter sp.]|uniref:hypothetical protein n=1 Tax=Piscinibacter sp. TaxID=1903157 RepID=UPI002B6701BD|nr:hypothetical protein [Albitalea sp.]HUG26214.1 hypothetical protein [Albitalea sp.]
MMISIKPEVFAELVGEQIQAYNRALHTPGADGEPALQRLRDLGFSEAKVAEVVALVHQAAPAVAQHDRDTLIEHGATSVH